MTETPEVAVIGAAILDVPAGPVDAGVFSSGSHPVERLRLGFGGDALNEATVLARLGKKVRLVSKIGDDPAGDLVWNRCRELGLDASYLIRQPGLDTGVNLVLIAPDGERSFVTASTGSLRALGPEDVPPQALDGVRLMSFASIFVSPRFNSEDTQALFRTARDRGLLTVADLTKPKRGERAEDLRGALSQLDYLFANQEEAALFTGKHTMAEMLDLLLAQGCRHVIVKAGARGCYLAEPGLRLHIPAVPGVRCVDSTGAGDSFAAGFLWALLEGMDPPLCARYANAAASLAVEAMGATCGVPGLEAVRERLAQVPEA